MHVYIFALHSSISWSLSLLPHCHVTASETGVQLKEVVLFMPGISNYGPPADFLWPSSTRTKLTTCVIEPLWRDFDMRDSLCRCSCLYKTTVRSESRCALRLRYVDLVVITEVAGEVCCCFTVFSC
jgi:hypothetical protein